jgi:hypothetical protein
MAEQPIPTDKASFDEAQELAQKFIDLANEFKNQGRSPQAISGGLMFASCIYATYSVAGNDGYLEAPGVEKIAAVYRRNLSEVQRRKRMLREKKQATQED